MKAEPILTIGSFLTVGTMSAARDPALSYEFMMALAGGSVITLCHSYYKSRQRKANGMDTALWATIATTGAFFLAFFFAPTLEGVGIPFMGDKHFTLPGAAFLIAVSGAPMIEWLVTGEAWKLVRSVITEFISGWKGRGTNGQG